MCRGLPQWLCTVRQRLDSALCSSDRLLPTSLLKTYLGGWGRQWVIPVQSLYTRLAHMLFLWKFPFPGMSRMRLPSASKYIICLCQLVTDAHEAWELMQSQTLIECLLYPYMVSSMVKSECFEVRSSWIQIPPFVFTGWVTLGNLLNLSGPQPPYLENRNKSRS